MSTPLYPHISTQIIEDPGDLEGWSEVNAEDRKTVLSLIEQHQEVLFTDILTVLADKYSNVLFSCSLKRLIVNIKER